MAKNSFKAKNSLNLEPQSSKPLNSESGDIFFDSQKNTFASKADYWSYLESKIDITYQADIYSSYFTSTITENAIIKITGSPSSSFNLHGLARNNDAKLLHIFNDTNQKMIIKHLSPTESVASAKISTPKGTDLSIAKKSLVILYFDDSAGIWFANQASGGSGGTSFDQIQVAHGFTLFTPIYHDGTTWVKAQANSASTLATYVVTEYSTNAFTATKFGMVEAPSHGLTIGEYYYVSKDVLGGLTTSEPLFGYSNPVLYVQDSTNVHIMVHRPSLIGDGNVSDSEIGAIMAFPASIEPVGFLYCDGRAVSRTTYRELYTTIGTIYGSGDGTTTFNLPDLRGQFLRGGVEFQSYDFLPAAVNITNDILTIPNHKFQHSGVRVRISTTSSLPGGLSSNTTYYVIYIDNNNIKLAASLANAKANTPINLTSIGAGTHSIYQWLNPDASSRYSLQNGGNSGPNFGSFEDDQFASHTHGGGTYTVTQVNGVGQPISGTSPTNQTGATGGNETRPKNVSVGFFIRYSPKGAIKGETLTEIFAGTISNATVATDGIMFFRAPRTMNIHKVVIQLFEKGTATGILSIDIKKNTTPNTVGMTSVLTSTVDANMSIVSDYYSSEGTVLTPKIVEGEWLRLDLTSVPSNFGSFYISVYGV